jgi:hypothetical protein
LDGVDFGEDNKPVNTTSSLIMPDETVQNDLAQIDKALDNQKLQREDIAKAKKAFGIADDADKLNVPGMRISKAATDWQLVAADAMYDAFKDDDLIGMLIADDVGLGKTWSCMTFLLKVRPCGRYPQGFFFMLIFTRCTRSYQAPSWSWCHPISLTNGLTSFSILLPNSRSGFTMVMVGRKRARTISF